MDKETILNEHKENLRRNRMRSSNIWKITTVIFLVLFVGALYFNGMPSFSQNDAAVDNAIGFINDNMLMGMATAEVQDVTEEYGLYKVDLLISSTTEDLSQEYTSYITKDGKILFPTVVDLTEYATIDTTEQPTETAQEVQVNTEVMNVDYSNEPVLGNENAPITIIVYSDFQCPYCQRGYYTMEQVIDEYGENLKAIFKNFPLSFHEYAEKAAEAGECANDQGMFWELHNLMYKNNQALTVEDLEGYAADLGLDTETFNTCLESGEKEAEVAKDMEDGVSAGITGTPTFFINGQMLVGAQPYESFAAIIDGILAEQPSEVVAEETPEEVTETEEVVEETPEEAVAEETTDSCGGCEEGTLCFNGECVPLN